MYTFDKRTLDATGVFLVGELEHLDQTLHAPLSSVTWGRDMLLRSDVSLADEVSSFTNSTFAAVGGSNPNGINWISGNSTAVSGIALDIGKKKPPHASVEHGTGLLHPRTGGGSTGRAVHRRPEVRGA